MHIDHIALWTKDIERMKEFYEKYFLAKAGQKYSNPARQFESYFLSFPSGARIELMHGPGTMEHHWDSSQESHGYAHIALAAGSEECVNQLTERLRNDGFSVIEDPRHTGDGYYESQVLDPDGNFIEITI